MTTRPSTSPADLPTGDALAPILDDYDDERLAAFVRGLLELYDMAPAGLDPYQSTTLDAFADVMVQDVITASKSGNPSPLIHYAYRGILDIAKDVWLADREGPDDDLVGDAILFALRGSPDPVTVDIDWDEPQEARRGHLYGLLRRLRAWGRVIRPASGASAVRSPGFGVDYLAPESGHADEADAEGLA